MFLIGTEIVKAWGLVFVKPDPKIMEIITKKLQPLIYSSAGVLIILKLKKIFPEFTVATAPTRLV